MIERATFARERSHTGEMVDVHERRAGGPAVVVFYRSAVWWPPCRTQLVELQSHADAFARDGITLLALSYDEPAALAAYAEEYGVAFPLLSDPDREIIERFGILNTLVDPDDHPWYGISFPGTYVADGDGMITAKFFEANLALRANADQLRRAALGEEIVVTPAAPAGPPGEVTVDGTVRWQSCDDVCHLPATHRFSLDLPAGESYQPEFRRGEGSTRMDFAEHFGAMVARRQES